jgi:hypothetical protein
MNQYQNRNPQNNKGVETTRELKRGVESLGVESLRCDCALP